MVKCLVMCRVLKGIVSSVLMFASMLVFTCILFSSILVIRSMLVISAICPMCLMWYRCSVCTTAAVMMTVQVVPCMLSMCLWCIPLLLNLLFPVTMPVLHTAAIIPMCVLHPHAHCIITSPHCITTSICRFVVKLEQQLRRGRYTRGHGTFPRA